ncbi:hypothetical protein C8F04DRAFT_1337304 [Mycena alexandri]|uniref:Uncharacterized protein n=1 Tax=Mycena alexandri TaxID=1745969 RepID=A0AAD6X5R3_9AGAR|nr:hypothetical protein C8F04DRAFT_1337304 [Mycena alexandri]
MPKQAVHESHATFAANVTNPLVKAVIQENYVEDSTTIVHSLRTIQNRLEALSSYNKFIELAYPHLIGNEWADTQKDSLSERAHEYLTQRVHSSKSRNDPKGHMSFQTLGALRWSLLWLAIQYGKVDKEEWTPLTYSWIKGLQRRYGLRSLPLERMVFGHEEVRLMIEEAYTNTVCWENSLQHSCGFQIDYIFGPRPSSLFLTPPAQTYLKLESIIIRRGEGRGQFIAEFHLTVFKGYSENQIEIVYTVRPPTLYRNTFLYLPGQICVLAILRGDFADHSTMQSLLDGTEDIIKWKDPQLPFFRQAGPRGRSVTMKPMKSANARGYFHKITRNIGIDGKYNVLFFSALLGC